MNDLKEPFEALRRNVKEIFNKSTQGIEGVQGLTGNNGLYEFLSSTAGTFEDSYTNWKLYYGPNPRHSEDQQIKFTKYLIEIFKLQKDENKIRAILGSSANQKSINTHKRILDYWKGNHGRLAGAVLSALQAYLGEINKGSKIVTVAFPTEFDIPAGITELKLSNFDKDNYDNFDARAKEFLRGSEPIGATAVHATATRRISGLVVALIQGNTKIVLLSGAIGDGLSTILWQIAFGCLGVGGDVPHRVFRINSFKGLAAAGEIYNQLKHSPVRPVFIYDNLRTLQFIPPWLTDMDNSEAWGHLILGGHRRNHDRVIKLLQENNLGQREYYQHFYIPQVENAEAPKYIEKMMEYEALVDGYEGLTKSEKAEKAKQLFINGLRHKKIYTGLWPAQYQVTRGEKLRDRIKSFVEELSLDTDTYKCLLPLVFLSFQHTLSIDNHNYHLIDPIPRKDLEEFIREVYVDFRTPHSNDTIRDNLTKLLKKLSGEIKPDWEHGRLHPIEFRHPQLVYSFFMACFGAADDDIGDLNKTQDKWEYYEPLIQTFFKKGEYNKAAMVLKLMRKSLNYDDQRALLKNRIPISDQGLRGENILDIYRGLPINSLLPEHDQIFHQMNMTCVYASLFDSKREGRFEDAAAHLRAVYSHATFKKNKRVMNDMATFLSSNAAVRKILATEIEWDKIMDSVIAMEQSGGTNSCVPSERRKLLLYAHRKDNLKFEAFETIFMRVQPFSSQGFDEYRLKFLQSLLSWSQKPIYLPNYSNDKNDLFYNHFGISKSNTPLCMFSIYHEILTELHRVNVLEGGNFSDPAFRKLEQGSDGANADGLRGTLIKLFNAWRVDLQREEFASEQYWGLEIIGKVVEYQEKQQNWRPFIEAYPALWKARLR